MFVVQLLVTGIIYFLLPLIFVGICSTKNLAVPQFTAKLFAIINALVVHFAIAIWMYKFTVDPSIPSAAPMFLWGFLSYYFMKSELSSNFTLYKDRKQHPAATTEDLHQSCTESTQFKSVVPSDASPRSSDLPAVNTPRKKVAVQPKKRNTPAPVASVNPDSASTSESAGTDELKKRTIKPHKRGVVVLIVLFILVAAILPAMCVYFYMEQRIQEKDAYLYQLKYMSQNSKDYFFDDNVAFLINESNTYHNYDCPQIKNRSDCIIRSVKEAEEMGKTLCPACHITDEQIKAAAEAAEAERNKPPAPDDTVVYINKFDYRHRGTVDFYHTKVCPDLKDQYETTTLGEIRSSGRFYIPCKHCRPPAK